MNSQYPITNVQQMTKSQALKALGIVAYDFIGHCELSIGH